MAEPGRSWCAGKKSGKTQGWLIVAAAPEIVTRERSCAKASHGKSTQRARVEKAVKAESDCRPEGHVALAFGGGDGPKAAATEADTATSCAALGGLPTPVSEPDSP